jgi:uncharacterized protein with GYD domain
MLSRSCALLATGLVVGFVAPVVAQQSMRHYLTYFTYTDTAMKAMMENPQDREAAARKLAEGFGGKLDVIYWTPAGGHDGFAVFEFPDDVTAAAVLALARSTGNFQRNETIPILTAEEFKAALQKAKEVKATTAYTAPTQTK